MCLEFSLHLDIQGIILLAYPECGFFVFLGTFDVWGKVGGGVGFGSAGMFFFGGCWCAGAFV